MSKRHTDEEEEEKPKHHEHGKEDKPYVGADTPTKPPPTDDPPNE